MHQDDPGALTGDTDSVFVRHALPKDVATVDAVAEASRLTVALADEVMLQTRTRMMLHPRPGQCDDEGAEEARV